MEGTVPWVYRRACACGYPNGACYVSKVLVTAFSEIVVLALIAADVVINVESERQGGMRAILQHLLEFFKAHPDFDVCTGLVEDYVYTPK